MKWDGKISKLLAIGFSLKCDFVGEIGFWSFRKIEGKLKKKNFTFWHSDFLDRFKGLICEQKGIIICRSDIFTCKTQQSPRNIERIFACNQHSLNPIARSISIRITERFMDRRNNLIMMIPIAIVI